MGINIGTTDSIPLNRQDKGYTAARAGKHIKNPAMSLAGDRRVVISGLQFVRSP